MQICCVTYVHTLKFVLIDCTVKKNWLNIKQRWAGPDVLQLKLYHDRFHIYFMMSVKQFELLMGGTEIISESQLTRNNVQVCVWQLILIDI